MAHSQYNYRDTLDRLVQSDTRWPDLGCDHTILPEWIRDSVPFSEKLLARCKLARGYDRVDDRPHVTGLEKKVIQGDRLPFEDESFNLVTANMVVEQLWTPFLSYARSVGSSARAGCLSLIPRISITLNISLRSYCRARSRALSLIMWTVANTTIFPAHYQINTRPAIKRLPGFRIQTLEAITTGPKYGRIPVLNWFESGMICAANFPGLRDLRSDWIAVLQKLDHDPASA
jgi:hypothetical protein